MYKESRPEKSRRLESGVYLIGMGTVGTVPRCSRHTIGFVLDCRADPAGKTRDYVSSWVNEEGTFREGEPQCRPLGEGGTRSLLSPRTTFRCSPESFHQWPLGIQELRQ
jgi:hypothetical protein